MQLWINKHEEIFLKTNKIAQARGASAICGLWRKLTSACLFQIAQEKSCNYVLIICMGKYKMAYYNQT